MDRVRGRGRGRVGAMATARVRFIRTKFGGRVLDTPKGWY